MDFGVGYFATHDGMGPGPLAQMLEERGQASLLMAEHSHIPAGRESPFPSGGDIPRKYLHTYDLFVALTAAAAATSRLRIGSGVCLVIQRDPIHTAKEVASIDHLSGGRFLFGVGAGWNREEMANHGTDYRTRMTLMRERIEAMKAIWAQDEATYHGELVRIDRVQSWPKPVQRPHPPILVGGHGPKVLDRVLAFGDLWVPNYDAEVVRRSAELFARAERSVGVHVLGAPADPKVFEELERGGIEHVAHWLPSGPRSRVERALEQWETAISEYTGG
jgi:probable F420-dependent oxidoreductase